MGVTHLGQSIRTDGAPQLRNYPIWFRYTILLLAFLGYGIDDRVVLSIKFKMYVVDEADESRKNSALCATPVSYTHLTLPTIYSV